MMVGQAAYVALQAATEMMSCCLLAHSLLC